MTWSLPALHCMPSREAKSLLVKSSINMSPLWARTSMAGKTTGPRNPKLMSAIAQNLLDGSGGAPLCEENRLNPAPLVSNDINQPVATTARVTMAIVLDVMGLVAVRKQSKGRTPGK